MAGRKGGWLTRAADLIWPPRSLLSDTVVTQPGAIEPSLWAELSFLTGPLCFRCGFPLPAYAGEEGVCGACAAEAPVYRRARAALAYDDHARRLVLELKRAGRRDGLPVFASWMAQAGAPLIADCDVIAPAPLHWRRLAQRTFNQAAWLAQALSAETARPWRPALLERRKARRSQAGLTASERRRNVQGAYEATPAARGLRVLLVDDVFTTGATVSACARALLKAGAAQVDVLTLARVVRPVDVSI